VSAVVPIPWLTKPASPNRSGAITCCAQSASSPCWLSSCPLHEVESRPRRVPSVPLELGITAFEARCDAFPEVFGMAQSVLLGGLAVEALSDLVHEVGAHGGPNGGHRQRRRCGDLSGQRVCGGTQLGFWRQLIAEPQSECLAARH